MKLNISESDNSQNLDLVMEVAPYFRVKAAATREILGNVVEAVRTWRDVAAASGLSKVAQERMRRAFRVVDS